MLETTLAVRVGQVLTLQGRDDIARRDLAFEARVVQEEATGAVARLHCQPCDTCNGGQWPREVKHLCQRLRVDQAIAEAGEQAGHQPHCPASELHPSAPVLLGQAKSIDDREAAYRLVYGAYFRKGLAAPAQNGLYTNSFLLNPQTVTFVGKVEGEVAMTLTSIPDSVAALPMDAVFEDCLAPLRKQGRRLVEFGMLAVSTEHFGAMNYSIHDPERMLCVYSLFRIALQHAKFTRGCTDVVFAVPPKHQALYRFMGVSAISEVRYYSNYNTPAVAIRIDLLSLELRPHVRQFLFGNPMAQLKDIGLTEWSVQALARLFGSGAVQGAPQDVAAHFNSETQ
ncbi:MULTISPECIES: N-acyl amino acid synthase FeeM domain-containing protein [unclassified Pseudomonas]|uniref:N-acyl amino acid synthase FeeM domain-containing protein n=1 Tax=unclassified Pseudomonas TaxID=196821 RepID=UPI00111A8B7D|nr:MULTISPECIES: hypothetical protein [unclassified Pseudomonas]MBI6952574.1 hypothetical protein [Pseudomonas sp. CCOS 191]